MTQRSFNFLPIIGGITLFFLFPLFIYKPARAAVVINELLPKTDPATLEWIELYNTGSESVSLNQWKLQTTTGAVQTFIFNASAVIAPHSFLTFTGSQTGISFAVDGDTVRLFDDKNMETDSQSYPGILGYNTSMGRSTDGAGTWALCTKATFNTNNNCPAPTPTPQTPPTNTPTPTRRTQPTPTPQPKTDRPPAGTPVPAHQTFGSYLPSPATPRVLGATDTLSPTPTPVADVLYFSVSKTRIAYILLGIAAIALTTMVVMWLRQRLIRNRKS